LRFHINREVDKAKNKAAGGIGNGTKLLYGLGAFGYGSIGQTMGSFMMFFGTGILGIPGSLMGLAVGIGTVWDAVTDPIVGHMSDNTRSRLFGKRHGYILFASFAVAISNYLLWSISPAWSVAAKFGCLVILLLIIETFSTLYSTPYSALGLDMSRTYDDRTAVQSYKTVFQFLSLAVPSILMTMFLTPTHYVTMNATNQGYQDIALFTSVLCIITGLICFFGTYRYRGTTLNNIQAGTAKANNLAKGAFSKGAKQGLTKHIFADFFSILKQKNVGLLILGYAVSLTAGAFITSLGLHVFTYTFGFSTIEIPIIMGCFIGGIVLAQPLWFWVSRKFDKVTALITALGTVIVAIVIFAAVLMFRNMIYPGQVMPFVCFTILLTGAGTGCLYSLPISMFADLIAMNNARAGEDKTAKAAGFLTFCTKISNAVIMFVIGVALDLIGFRGSSAVQPLATQNWLGWLLIAGVAAAAVASIFIYSRYSYGKEDFLVNEANEK
jgi:Na+/melibiose symporter-like transporter